MISIRLYGHLSNMTDEKIKSMLKYVKDLWFNKDIDLLSNHDAKLDAACEANFLMGYFLVETMFFLFPKSFYYAVQMALQV